MVCLDSSEPHIRVLWGAHFMTPSFTQPTLQDRKVIAFARDIRLGLFPAIVVVKLEWITPGKVNPPQAVDMDYLMARLAPGHPRLPPDTPRPDRVSVTWVSLVPLYLVHPLIFSPFLVPATVWHMMHTKYDVMGMTQRVAPFLYWLRAATVEPQQGIAALTSVDLADATLAQRQGIRTSLAPPPPPPQPPIQILPLQNPLQIQAPPPPPAPTREAVMPTERWGADLRSLLQVCNSSTAAQLPEIWRTVEPLKKDRDRYAMEAA